MKQFVVLVIFFSLFVSGCKTISTNVVIPITPSLASESTLYLIKKPNVTITDDAYNQAIGPYRIVRSNISRKHKKKTQKLMKMSDQLHEKEVAKEGDTLFLFGFTADDMSDKNEIQNWNVISQSQSFSFDLEKESGLKWQSECLYQQQHYQRKEIDSGTVHKLYTSGHYQCKIHNEKELEKLSIVGEFKQQRKAQLLNNQYGITLVSTNENELEALDEHKTVYYKPEKPLPKSAVSGYYFKRGDKLIGAVSLGSKTGRVWLSRHNSDEINDLLMAVSYSTFMFQWKAEIYDSGSNEKIFMGEDFEGHGFKKRL